MGGHPDSTKDRNLIIPLGQQAQADHPSCRMAIASSFDGKPVDAVMHGESVKKPVFAWLPAFENFSPVGNRLAMIRSLGIGCYYCRLQSRFRRCRQTLRIWQADAPG